MQFDYLLSAAAQTSLLYPLLASFALAAAFSPFYIRWLKANEIRQFLREEGPASHAAKARTPTTGGVCFIAAIVSTFTATLFCSHKPDWVSMQVLILALMCGLIGLSDDLAKVRRKANAGLSAALRLKIEIALGAGFGLFWLIFSPNVQNLLLPAHHQGQIWPWLFVCLSSFLVAATANAVNLHDGMDGLAAGTSILMLAAMAVILVSTNQVALAQLALITVGALLAFLIFNKYPAKIFMGDTGSLFLGGIMAGLALASGTLFWFVPLTAVYIAEALSVILQVGYFKLTKPYVPREPMSKPALIWLKLTKKLPGEGKRLFRMAPLHHHFEAVLAQRGVPEWQVVLGFWGVQLIICLTLLTAFFWR